MTAELERSPSVEGRHLRGTISIVFTYVSLTGFFSTVRQQCAHTSHDLPLMSDSVGLPKWLMWFMAFDQLCSSNNNYTK